MEKQITKKLMAIVMRDGIEIWIEDDKIQNLKKVLMMTEKSKFIELGNEVINSADVLGIFSPKTMESKTRRKNGQWKCKWNFWHNRGERCAHGEIKKYEERTFLKKINKEGLNKFKKMKTTMLKDKMSMKKC